MEEEWRENIENIRFKDVSNTDTRCSVDGRKQYGNDKCGRKSFRKQNKTIPFPFENGVVWTGS